MDEDHVTEQPQTRDIPPMQMEARAMPDSWNEEGRSLEVVCSTGARVRRYDLWKDEEFNEELSMIRPISVWGASITTHQSVILTPRIHCAM